MHCYEDDNRKVVDVDAMMVWRAQCSEGCELIKNAL